MNEPFFKAYRGAEVPPPPWDHSQCPVPGHAEECVHVYLRDAADYSKMWSWFPSKKLWDSVRESIKTEAKFLGDEERDFTLLRESDGSITVKFNPPFLEENQS